MLTPIEIQGKVFKSGIGYDRKDTDAFMKEVLQSYEVIYKENVELNDKLSVLSEGIQYYKTIEKTLQKALVLAEMTSKEVKSSAEKEAAAIINEAKAQGKLIVADAKNDLKHIHSRTTALLQEYEKYRVQFKQLAAAQLELLESEIFQINVSGLDAYLEDSIPEENTDEKDIAGMETEDIVHNVLKEQEEREHERQQADNSENSDSGDYSVDVEDFEFLS